jgi:tRNA A-37 threonylcarbamoyl transferase component Bud32
MGAQVAPSLDVAVAAALAASDQRIVRIEHEGAALIAKRAGQQPRRLPQALAVRWLVKRTTGLLVPLKTLLLSNREGALANEARRLRALAASGVRVPRVVRLASDFLLLEHCGPSVASMLAHWSADTRHDELCAEAVALGEFHLAGHWHGAAQVKNLTRRDGHTWRIDFEEDFGEFLPLAAAQATDLVLLLNSVCLRGPIGESEARALVPRMLDAYFAANPDPRLRQELARALPLVRRLLRFAAPFKGATLRNRPHRGVARLLLLVEALSAWLG